jgi:glutamyl-tRNA reductase
MPIFVLGLNHRSAPLDVREKVAFANDEQRSALEALRQATGIPESVLVSTCNRTELYLRGEAADVDAAQQWLRQTPNAARFDLTPYLYRHQGSDATRHAFRVAAGLDSMVLGEPQILGQVRHAVRVANDLGALGGPLDRLFQDTFQVAKKVRTETAIGATSVSMAAAALKLAGQLFGDLSETRVLFIGVGEMIDLAATHFTAAKPRSMTVANRTIARARALAAQYQADAIGLDELQSRVHEFDAIITSTASTLPIIGKGMIERALKKRRHQPIFIVDLAVPRDVEAAVADLDDVYLYTLDSLGKVISENMARRESAVADAEAIIARHADMYSKWLAARSTVPVIQQLRGRADHYRATELDRARKMLARGDAPEAVLNALASGLTNKFLHHPLAALKTVSAEQREALTDAIDLLYPALDSDAPPHHADDALQ